MAHQSKTPDLKLVHTATATAYFLMFLCRRLLSSQMGIMTTNGGVHMVTAFLSPKIAVAVAV